MEKFLSAESFDDLPRNYRAPAEAIQKWNQLCGKEALKVLEKNADKPVEKIDCISRTIDGVTYRIYGVIHGWSGGPNREYRKLVNHSLASEENILFEKVLGNLYATHNKVQIPDFWVLGRFVQFILGFRLCLFFPWLILTSIWDIIKESISHNTGETSLNNIFYSLDYHKLPPEVRRGVGGSLPTKLSIRHEMGLWRSLKRYWSFEVSLAVVARSAYMAEFAKEYAREKEITELAIVVGDRHLTEVEYYLQNPLEMPRISKAAQKHGRKIARHSSYYYLMFSTYLLVVGIGASLAAAIYMLGYTIYQFYKPYWF